MLGFCCCRLQALCGPAIAKVNEARSTSFLVLLMAASRYRIVMLSRSADAPWGARILKSLSDVSGSRQSERPFALLIWFMT